MTKRAEINKKTFYRYYPTLADLLAEMQEQCAQSYIDLINDLSLPDDLEKMQRAFFDFSAEKGEAYDKITISQTSIETFVKTWWILPWLPLGPS
ncbi:TetR/AcrR family transcriptional regulator [Streptococcus pantholopis]|uniref:HTH tetR-type domain-containing protein n=1 Tax=Streptococcus pantholopis TaxID=1811193 RepID=A0A172Q6L5_9STRE|nr:TetR/AcrR family transcriptional regulator [Streptococcus pantholopis]AND79106.1 hypothetical protein A0O21_03230 [Streptococcus pantholopis]